MDDEHKVISIFIVCVTVAVLSLLSWGAFGSYNNHDFDVKCIQSGKKLQYRSLDGQSTAYKECV